MLSNIKGAWSVSLTFVGALWHPCIGPIWYPSNACETCRDRLEGQRVTVEREREKEREKEGERERERRRERKREREREAGSMYI